MPKSAPKDERAIYDFIHELYKTRRVSDKTYKRVQAVLGDAATVELVGILGYYVMIAMILNVYRMMPPEDSPLPFRGEIACRSAGGRSPRCECGEPANQATRPTAPAGSDARPPVAGACVLCRFTRWSSMSRNSSCGIDRSDHRALPEVAAHGHQRAQVGLRLDAARHRRTTAAVGKIDDRLANAGIGWRRWRNP